MSFFARQNVEPGAAALPLTRLGSERPSIATVRDSAPWLSPALLTRLSDALSVPDGGFSISVRDFTEVRKGYAVSLFPHAEQRISGLVTAEHIARYLSDQASALKQQDVLLGGWRSPTDNLAYLDVSTIVPDRTRALTLARVHDQSAIWDFAAGNSISVDEAAWRQPMTSAAIGKKTAANVASLLALLGTKDIEKVTDAAQALFTYCYDTERAYKQAARTRLAEELSTLDLTGLTANRTDSEAREYEPADRRDWP